VTSLNFVCLRYVTKCCNYVSKPEEAFKNLKKTSFLGAPSADRRPHEACRSALFSLINRDYSAQEVAAINLGYDAVSHSHQFVNINWDGRSREILPDDDAPGNIQTRWNHREIYFNRLSICAANKPEPIKAQSVEDRKLQLLKHKRMMQHIGSLCMIDFFKYYDCIFRPASPARLPMAERHVVTCREAPENIIPIAIPDLPTAYRDTAHRNHENYCEYRLLTLKPYASEEAWDEFVRSAAENWERDTSIDKTQLGKFHLAYKEFRCEEEKKKDFTAGTRIQRLIKFDSDLPKCE